MTREEFEARMGNTVTEEAWEAIRELYYNCTDIDNWDTFADDYKLHGTSKVLANIWSRFQLKMQVERIQESRLKLAAETLIDSDPKCEDNTLYDLACELAGQQYVVLFKINQSRMLCDKDREYINDNLK